MFCISGIAFSKEEKRKRRTLFIKHGIKTNFLSFLFFIFLADLDPLRHLEQPPFSTQLGLLIVQNFRNTFRNKKLMGLYLLLCIIMGEYHSSIYILASNLLITWLNLIYIQASFLLKSSSASHMAMSSLGISLAFAFSLLSCNLMRSKF